MRTKVIYFFSALFLVGVMFLATPATLLASTSDGNAELSGEYSKTVTVTKGFGPYEKIPETYYYNVAGWSGTLNKIHEQDVGVGKRVIYEGTVTCFGTCPMTNWKNNSKSMGRVYIHLNGPS